MTRSMSTTIGIDVGGTFTDVVAADGDGGVTVAKVPSTRGREADGFEAGVAAVASDLAALSAIVHGTTVATNALLERGGARTGLITTEGFRDVLEMRRRDRPRTWGLWEVGMACLRGHMTAGPDALAASSSSVPEGVHTASTNAAAAAAAEARFAGMKPSSASVIARSGLGRYDTVLETLTVQGTPIPVLEGVDTVDVNGCAQYAFSDDGDLAYLSAGEDKAELELAWLHVSGKSSRPDIDDPYLMQLSLGPDGGRLAALVPAPIRGSQKGSRGSF